MSRNYDEIVSNLEMVYRRAIRSTSDRVFFQSIFDYIEAFDQEPDLVPVNKKIIALADQDLKKEIDLQNKVEKEVLNAHKKVLKYLKKNRTDSRVVKDRLQAVTNVATGELISSNGKTKQMYLDITYALMILAQTDENKHLEFCRKFGKIHDNASVDNWNKLSPSYVKWQTEREKNRRLLKFKVWHAWNEIVLFHNWLVDFEGKRDELLNTNKFMELLAVNSKFKAMQSAVTGEPLEKSSTSFEMKRDEYQRFLDMIHQFIKQNFKTKVIATNTDINCKYDSDTGLLTINNKSIRFLPKKIRGLILAIYFKNKSSRKKKFYWEDILDEIDEYGSGSLNQEQKRHRVFYAVEGINNRILKEFQISNFFLYIDGYISLNTKFYLK